MSMWQASLLEFNSMDLSHSLSKDAIFSKVLYIYIYIYLLMMVVLIVSDGEHGVSTKGFQVPLIFYIFVILYIYLLISDSGVLVISDNEHKLCEVAHAGCVVLGLTLDSWARA